MKHDQHNKHKSIYVCTQLLQIVRIKCDENIRDWPDVNYVSVDNTFSPQLLCRLGSPAKRSLCGHFALIIQKTTKTFNVKGTLLTVNSKRISTEGEHCYTHNNNQRTCMWFQLLRDDDSTLYSGLLRFTHLFKRDQKSIDGRNICRVQFSSNISPNTPQFWCILYSRSRMCRHHRVLQRLWGMK